MVAPSLKTERLLLRQWQDSDLAAFAKMNADKKVMEYFPSTLSTEESDALAKVIQHELQEKDYGLWAVEILGKASFIGFVGLHYQDFDAPFTPCVEIGWRISQDYWGKGYAIEAAKRVEEYAFADLKLKELVSFTAKVNHRSIKLMEKLGMQRNPEEDFEHSKLPKGHALSWHVLYRKEN